MWVSETTELRFALYFANVDKSSRIYSSDDFPCDLKLQCKMETYACGIPWVTTMSNKTFCHSWRWLLILNRYTELVWVSLHYYTFLFVTSSKEYCGPETFKVDAFLSRKVLSVWFQGDTDKWDATQYISHTHNRKDLTWA